MKMLPLMLGALALAACVSDRTNGDSLDEIAKDYVQMTLEIGEREPGYVDAYYGPAEWDDPAKAAPPSLQVLTAEAANLPSRTHGNVPPGTAPVQRRPRPLQPRQQPRETRRGQE